METPAAPAPSPVQSTTAAVTAYLDSKKPLPEVVVPAATPPAVVAPTGGTNPVEAVPEVLDAKGVGTIVTQSKKIRELEGRIKELAAAPAPAAPDYTADWEADPVAAFGKAFKGDPEAMLDHLFKSWVNGKAAAPDAPTATGDAPTALEKQVQDLAKWKADREAKEKADSEGIARTAAQKAANEQVDGYMATFVDPATKAALYPLSAKAENRADAMRFANETVIALAEAQGIPMDTQDADVIAGLYKQGFAIAEERLREMGKRFTLDTTANPSGSEKPPASANQISPRATQRPAVQIAPVKAVMNVDDAKARAAQAIRDMIAAQARK